MTDTYTPETNGHDETEEAAETVRSAPPETIPQPAYVIRQADKSKGLALALAILLGPWTWLYTYEKDAWKFWVAMALGALATVALLFLAPIGWIPLWVWAIVDVVLKRQHFYDHYRTPDA